MKFFKKSLSLLIAIVVIFSAFCFTVSAAATSTIYCGTKTVKIGGSVSVTVKIKATEEMYATEGYLDYDPKVLKFTSGTSAAADGAGTVKMVGTPGGATEQSHTINFTTIGVGSSGIKFRDASYVGAVKTSVSGSSITVSVTDNKSDNADLSSIKVSNGKLSPSFNKNTTKYKVLVGNTVKSCTITAIAADKGAKVAVTPNTSSLNVGDNTRTITVTAQSGKTKVYTVVITRSKEGDASSDSSNSSEGTSSSTEEKNPLEAELGGETYTVLTETTEKPIPAGFVENKVKYNEIEVKTAKTEDGKMELYFLKNNDTGAVDYYLLDDETKTFKLLSYFTINNKMYIVSKEGMKGTVEGYYKTNVILGNTSVEAFTSLDERLSDFYIIYCFTDGKYGYYSYDMAEATIQRMPTFKSAFKPQKETEEKQTSATPFFTKIAKSISNIGKLPLMGKIVIAAIIVVIICIIALIVMLIIKFIPKRDREDLEEDNDAIFDEVHFETSSIEERENDPEEN